MPAVYDHAWWLAFTCYENNANSDDVEVSFLEARGPSQTFNYPTRDKQ